jgi:hypothetical protein
LITATTDEVTVGVVCGAAARANVPDAQTTKAFLIIPLKRCRRMLLLISYEVKPTGVSWFALSTTF